MDAAPSGFQLQYFSNAENKGRVVALAIDGEPVVVLDAAEAADLADALLRGARWISTGQIEAASALKGNAPGSNAKN